MSKALQQGNKVWLILDDRPGHKTQLFGVGEELKKEGFEVFEKQIVFTKWAKIPNFLKPSYLFGLEKNSRSTLEAQLTAENAPANAPAIIIGAGRKTAPIVYWLKRRAKKINPSLRVISVQLMDPKFRNSSYDLLVIPEHDNPLKRKNIYSVVTMPMAINEVLLKQEAEKWAKSLEKAIHPVIAIIVGGDTKEHKFTPSKAKRLVAYTNKLVHKFKGSIIVTNSRRTSKELTEYLNKNLHRVLVRYDVNTSKDNPYYAFLNIADIIIVTGDSASMVSEACFFGKPVFIYDPTNIVPKKFRNFHKVLYKHLYAYTLDTFFFSRIFKVANLFVKKKLRPPSLYVNQEVAHRIKMVYSGSEGKF